MKIGPHILLALTGLSLAGSPALSAPPDISAPLEGDMLKAGQFLWQPQRSPEGNVEVVISLSNQRAYVFRGGEAIGISTISSGEEGRETPYGRFTILEKQRHHKSNRYDDAPMPYMMRLTWGGIALHAGNLPGYPASHGCIRLPAGFASKLFATADVGTEVFVTYASPASPEEAMEIARAGIEYPGHLPDEVSS